MRRAKILFVVVALALLVAPAAQAGIINFSSAAAWKAAVGPFATEDFNDNILNPGLSVTTVNGSIQPGGFWFDMLVPGGASTTWTFANPISYWGASFDFTPGGSGVGVNVSVDFLFGGVVLAHTILNPSISEPFVGFYGLLATQSFDKVILSADGQFGGAGVERLNMDNMMYGVPDASPLIWLTPGALCIAEFVRRRLLRR